MENRHELLGQIFAVRQMVAVPPNKRRVAGVFKQKWQRRRFGMAVAKDHVGFGLLRTHAVKAFGEIRIAQIIEVIGAADQRVGDDRRPGLQIGGSFHDYGGVSGPRNSNLEFVALHTQAITGTKDLWPRLIPQCRGPAAESAAPACSARQTIRFAGLAIKKHGVRAARLTIDQRGVSSKERLVQARAIPERRAANVGDAVANRHIGQAGTTIESIEANVNDAVGNRDA